MRLLVLLLAVAACGRPTPPAAPGHLPAEGLVLHHDLLRHAIVVPLYGSEPLVDPGGTLYASLRLPGGNEEAVVSADGELAPHSLPLERGLALVAAGHDQRAWWRLTRGRQGFAVEMVFPELGVYCEARGLGSRQRAEAALELCAQIRPATDEELRDAIIEETPPEPDYGDCGA